MNSRRPLLIDTDTASDDAVALIMALAHPGVRVEAITVVAGNVPLPQAVQNALYTLELCGASVPVHAGAERPLQRALETAQSVHGRDGMGDIGLELEGRVPAPGHAVDVIAETAMRSDRSLTLVTLGPLTNVALALRREPALARRIERCVVMGGVGSGHGNVTPLAEYNVWVDPEAARVVFGSGMPLTMVGWDISRTSAVIDPETAARLRSIGTDRARFAVDIQRHVTRFATSQMGLAGFDLPDPIAMAVALEPDLATTARHHVAIGTDGPARGQTIVGEHGAPGGPPNVDLVTHVPRERFLALLEASLR